MGTLTLTNVKFINIEPGVETGIAGDLKGQIVAGIITTGMIGIQIGKTSAGCTYPGVTPTQYSPCAVIIWDGGEVTGLNRDYNQPTGTTDIDNWWGGAIMAYMALSITIKNVDFHDNFACVSDLAPASVTVPTALINLKNAGYVSISSCTFTHNMAKSGMISIRMQRQYVSNYNDINVDLRFLSFRYTFSSYAAQAITVKSDGEDGEANINVNISNCSFEYGHGVNSYGAVVITGVLSASQAASFPYTHPITLVQAQVQPPFITLKSLTFSRNYSGKSTTSGVNIEEYAVVTMEDCTFTDLAAHGSDTPQGYSMWQYMKDTNMMQTAPTPASTVVQQASGVVSLLHILRVSIANVRFNSNDSGNSAALSVFSYHSLAVSTVLFDSNQALGNTPIALQFGMCPLSMGATASFTSCQFTTNTSRNGQTATRGVAGSFQSISCRGKLTSIDIERIRMTSPTFTSNEMGILVDSGAYLEVTSGAFAANNSPKYAVICFFIPANNVYSSAKFTLTACIFTENRNEGMNSADIYLSGNEETQWELQISACKFSGSHGGMPGSIDMHAGVLFSSVEGSSFISNCLFIHTNSDYGSGALTINFKSGVLMVSDTVFTNPTTGKNADISAILAGQEANPQRINPSSPATYLLLTSVTITGSTNAQSAIQISQFQAELRTKSCVFSNIENVAILNQGGYYVDTGSVFTGTGTATTRRYYKSTSKGIGWMTGSLFQSGYSLDYGGAVYLMDFGTSLTISDATFDSNTAISKGGAIYISSIASASVTNCIFTNNQAVFGSAIYQLTSFSAITDISRSTFRLNSGIGVIYALEGNISVASSTFEGNLSTVTPGIYVLLTTLRTASCTFRDQKCNQGCFILAIAGSTYTDNGSSFANAVSEGSGSVAFVQGSKVTFIGANFSANKSATSGTIHALDQSTLTLSRVSFQNCVTSDGINSGASVLHLEQSGLSISGPSVIQYFNNMGIYVNVATNVTIEGLNMMDGNGTAVDGGGLNCVQCGMLSIANSVFQRIESGYGGCIMLDGSLQSVYTITNTVFSACKALMGGAIYANNKGLTVLSSNFTGNTAISSPATASYDYGRGGALYLLCEDKAKCPSTINNTIFTANSAYSNGGAICWEDFEPTFFNVTYSGNKAKYGPDRAAFAVQIAPWKERYSSRSLAFAPEISNAVSGQVGKSPPIYMALYDKYGQIVTTDNVSSALLDTKEEGTSLSGSQKVTALYGTFIFNSYGITAEPGSETSIIVSSDGIDASKTVAETSKTSLVISLRYCVIGEIYTSSKACLICEVNTYSLEPNATYCSPCPSTSVCIGGANIYPQAGFWRSKNTTDKFFECPRPASCLGHANYTSNIGACADGYTGNMCNTCADQYSRTAKNTCQECPDPAVNGIRICGITIAVLILIIFLVKSTMSSALRPRELTSVYLRILMNYLQLVMLTSTFNLNWPNEVKSLLSAQESAGTATAQIFSFDCYMSELSTTNVIYQKLTLMFVLPVFIVVISFLFWGVLAVKRSDFSVIRNQMVSTIIILLFLAHPSLVQSIFSILSCSEIDPGESWLVADPSIRCWQEEHMFYTVVVGIPGVGIWCLGIPAVAMLIIIKNRRELTYINIKAKYGFLYNGYKPERFYWEFVIIYRKILVIFISVFISTVSIEVQALSVMLVIFIAFYLQHSCQPYNAQELNDLELMSIVTSGITIYSGLYFLSKSLTNSAGLVFFALILVSNCVFLAYWLFGISQAFMEKLAKRKPRLMRRLCPCISAVFRVANEQIKSLDLQHFDVIDDYQCKSVVDLNRIPEESWEESPGFMHSEEWLESDVHLYIAVMQARVRRAKRQSLRSSGDVSTLLEAA